MDRAVRIMQKERTRTFAVSGTLDTPADWQPPHTMTPSTSVTARAPLSGFLCLAIVLVRPGSRVALERGAERWRKSG